MKENTNPSLIRISLDVDQYRELLGVLDMGLLIKESVREIRGEPSKAFVALERKILEAAIETDAEDLIQDTGKRLMPADDIMDETEVEINEYIEDQFWIELSDRLGQRDFLENVTEEEIDEIDSADSLVPEGVRIYYDKYDREFDKHGLDRLRVEGK